MFYLFKISIHDFFADITHFKLDSILYLITMVLSRMIYYRLQLRSTLNSALLKITTDPFQLQLRLT